MVSTPTNKSAATRLVADRWTANLAAAGWTPVSDFFLDNYHRLTPSMKYSEAMFVIHIMRHKWDKAAPYPGFRSVAKRMGVSPEATRLLARSLEKKGYLYRQMRVSQTNRFHFDSLFAALEKLKSADAIAAINEKHRQTLEEQSFTPPMRPDLAATAG